MNPRMLVPNSLAACAVCLLAACAQGPSAPADTPARAGSPVPNANANWIANGATACDRYLTREFVASIKDKPAGKSKTLSPQACTFVLDDGGSIDITLTNEDARAFEDYTRHNVVGARPLAGVGDEAVQSDIGIDAHQGTNRGCGIDAGSLKLRGADLGHKLGEICNALFALP